MAEDRQSPLRNDELDPRVCTHDTRQRVLRQVPLFRTLSDVELEKVSGYFQARDFGAGEVIYRSGDPARELFVVATGKVKILDYTATGQQVVFDLLAPGESFGSLLSLGDETYSNDAQAQTFCCLLTISAETFADLIERYPRVAVAALEATAARLRESRKVVGELSGMPVEQRLAATLLKLSEKLGEQHENGLLLQIPLPQHDLAAMMGTTPESVNRSLSRFRRGELLESGRTWLIIKDVGRLREIAEGRLSELQRA